MTKKKSLWVLPLLLISQISQGQISPAEDDLFAEESLPIVLSATRLRQSQLETPASVTIITRRQINATGARDLVEALRLVPGLNIAYSRNNMPEVSIHGFLTEFSRRLQVLVDGHPIFKPGLSRVLWNNLPVNIDEVERIEVIRGPNTSSYGSNAFLGVINIVTRHPSDIESHSVSLTTGNNGIADAYVRVAHQADKFGYRLSAGHQQDNGFTGEFNGVMRFDESKNEYFRGDFSYQANMRNSLRFSLGHAQSEQDIDHLDIYQLHPSHPLKVEDTAVQLNWEHQVNNRHSVMVNAFHAASNNRESWQTCPPAFFMTQELGDLYDLDSDYTSLFVDALITGSAIPAPSSAAIASLAQQAAIRAAGLGSATVCGTANQNFDETKWGFELEDHYEFNANLRMVTGIGLRKDKIRGNSLFDGEPSNSTFYLFGNLEWKLSPKWLFNSGLLYEKDDFINSATSPRFALNYLASANSAWRFILAKGVRTPDFYEQVGHRHYRVSNLDTPINGTDNFATFYLTPQSQGNLKEEKVLSREIGWFYNHRDFSFDVKIFHEEVKDGIEGLLSLAEYNPANSINFTNKGAEFQLNYKLSPQDEIWLSYSHLDYDAKSGSGMNPHIAEQTAALLYQRQFDENNQVSFAYYLQELANGETFDRLDLRYGTQFDFTHSKLTLDFVVQHRLNSDSFFNRRNVIGEQTIAFLKASVNF